MHQIFVAISPDEVDLLFTPENRERLEALGSVAYGPTELAADTGAAFDVVVTSWSTQKFPLPAVTGERLRFGAHAAGSVRGLWPRQALEGMRLSQSAAAMTPAVAEMALTLTLCLLRHVHTFDRSMSTGGDWTVSRGTGLGTALTDCTVGVVGLSRAGREYIRLVRALGVSRVVAFDPYAAPMDGVELVGLDEVFAVGDVVAIHAPYTPDTMHMIGADQLARMRDGAILINTARSRVVDTAALTAELVSGRIRAGLDVFDEEPLPVSSPLRGRPNVMVIPHQAGATGEARRLQGQIAVDEVERFVHGQPLEHEVTAELYDRLA
ncbi:MAG TPA: hydroxyacid dehydrogenase [Mycobacteriales bacterium]|nr:hydroxyacid dehydrogenase [Mycobacteriales bacterium]